MSSRDSLAELDATAQAELVARGDATPRELVAAACERIERVDAELGAVPVRLFEAALRAADAAPRAAPFAGVPFLMKDVGARQAGQPYFAANRALRDVGYRAECDTPLGARFRELGLVTVGNSNTPEFGLQSITWPLAYGPTRNPWDPSRSPGGSSGGACAAVAAGLVPVAHASDGAGSIRIPAAWCGLVGLKPSRDRVVWRHAGEGRPEVEFVVARSLRDTAALLEALHRPRAGPRPRRGFGEAWRRAPPALRVGLQLRSPAGSVRRECLEAAVAAGHALEACGHGVEESAPAALFESEERSLYGAIFGLQGYRECLVELEERLQRPVEPDDVEPFLWTLAGLEEGHVSESDVERAVEWNRHWVGRVLAWFDDHDLLVTPTVGEPAPPLEALDPHRHEPFELLEGMLDHMAFTEPWNATGQPALSLPLSITPAGLPVGVQLVAAPGREDLLLAVAGQLQPFASADRHPRIHA